MTTQDIISICIAVFNAILAMLYYKQQRNYTSLKHEMNSMKDAVVKATGEAAFSAGKTEERLNPEIRNQRT